MVSSANSDSQHSQGKESSRIEGAQESQDSTEQGDSQPSQESRVLFDPNNAVSETAAADSKTTSSTTPIYGERGRIDKEAEAATADVARQMAEQEFKSFLARNGYRMRRGVHGAFLDELKEDFPTFWWKFKDQLKGPNPDKDVDDVLKLFTTMGLAQRIDDTPKDTGTVQAMGDTLFLKLRLEPAISHVKNNRLRGQFTNPDHVLGFEVMTPLGEPIVLDFDERIQRMDRLFDQLGRKHVPMELQGVEREDEDGNRQFWVYGVHVQDLIGTAVSDGQLQFIIDRLLTAPARKDEVDVSYHPHISGINPIQLFLDCANDTLPRGIETWARHTLKICNNPNISPEEKKHAQRALEIMLNIRWEGNQFAPIDPIAARRVLDEELYGMDEVKQRVIETIIQINRTGTLPSYGMLLIGPAGTGKSRIAYAVAKILRMPWAVLDMSAIRDPEALTGSSRIYINGKPGRIMEAFMRAGTSNIVYVINELDKAEEAGNNGSSADALLTLLDNLGFTDAYMECAVPTDGVYPIATANDESKISDPLLTRFVNIHIPGYKPEEKAIIFRDYSFPRALRRMNMKAEECQVSDDAIDLIVSKYAKEPGCRDIEQVAEHLAAHALYRIEATGDAGVSYDASDVEGLLKR